MRIPSYFAFSQQTILKTPVPAQTFADTGVSLITFAATKPVEQKRSVELLGVFFNRHANHVAPLGPRAVIVAHVVKAQEELQHKPGVRTLCTNMGVQNDVGCRTEFAIGFVQLLERAEGGIGVSSRVPLDVGGARDMPVAERGAVLRVTIGGIRRGLALEFFGAAGINQCTLGILVH